MRRKECSRRRTRGGLGGVRQQGTRDEASIYRQVVGTGGLVVLVLSLTPTGACIDPYEAWWRTRWQWMQRALRPDHAAPAVTVNPLLLYLGMLLSVGGLAVAWRSDRGTSPTRAGKRRARQIFIGGLAYTTTREEVRQLFAAYGEVAHVHL